MILISFGVIPPISSAELEDAARCAFPHADSQHHIDAIANRANEVSKKESLFALVTLARLCDKLGLDRNTLAIQRDSGGRPFFLNSSINFTVSHSGGAVAVALSDSGSVGIDIETADIPTDRAKKLADRYFTSNEQTEIEHDPSQFARIWTEKEAYAKLTGIPLASLLSSKKSISTHSDEIGSTSAPRGVIFHRFTLGAYPITLCTESDADVTLIPLNLNHQLP